MIAAVMSWFLGSRVGQWLIAAGAIVVGILVALGRAKDAGKREARAEGHKQTLDAVGRAKNAQDRVDAANRADLDGMRSKWTKP